jgi:magnesium transporter
MPEPGSAPGTVAPPVDSPPPVIQRMVFGPDGCETIEIPLDDLDKAVAPVPGRTLWVDVQGLGDIEALRRLGSSLGLHPLTVEDIFHTHLRPKVEEFEDYLFIIIRAVRLLEDGHVDNEQLSLVLKDGMLITFQERAGDGFDAVRKRLREGRGQLRRSGADYLAYALIDAAIDNYFPVLEVYGDSMDRLDEEVRENPKPEVSASIHMMRRELRQFRRAAWPLRDVAGTLGRTELNRIADPTRIAFRDCYDHALQVADFVESSRERSSDLSDLYVTMVSERTNQVMKVLTIIATIFIPLTFLCGLYGMNFDPEVSPYNMPELKWKYGYLAFWAVLIVTFVTMLWFFWRRGWIGSKPPDKESR